MVFCASNSNGLRHNLIVLIAPVSLNFWNACHLPSLVPSFPWCTLPVHLDSALKLQLCSRPFRVANFSQPCRVFSWVYYQMSHFHWNLCTNFLSTSSLGFTSSFPILSSLISLLWISIDRGQRFITCKNFTVICWVPGFICDGGIFFSDNFIFFLFFLVWLGIDLCWEHFPFLSKFWWVKSFLN